MVLQQGMQECRRLVVCLAQHIVDGRCISPAASHALEQFSYQLRPVRPSRCPVSQARARVCAEIGWCVRRLCCQTLQAKNMATGLRFRRPRMKPAGAQTPSAPSGIVVLSAFQSVLISTRSTRSVHLYGAVGKNCIPDHIRTKRHPFPQRPKDRVPGLRFHSTICALLAHGPPLLCTSRSVRF